MLGMSTPSLFLSLSTEEVDGLASVLGQIAQLPPPFSDGEDLTKFLRRMAEEPAKLVVWLGAALSLLGPDTDRMIMGTITNAQIVLQKRLPFIGVPTPARYALAVAIQNVKCFGDFQEIHVADERGIPFRWTVVLGSNGAGKTTLLKAIAVANPQPSMGRFAGPPSSIPSFRPQVPDMARVQTHELKRRPSDGFYSSQVNWPDWIGNVPTTVTGSVFGLQIGMGAKLDHDPSIVIQASVLVDQESYVTNTTSYGFPEMLVVGYGASRQFGEVGLTSSWSSSPTESLFDAGTKLLNPEEWLLRLHYKSLVEPAGSTKLLHQIEQLIADILPLVDEVRTTGRTHGNDLSGSVEYRTVDGTLLGRELSLGYQTVLTWVVDLAARLSAHFPNSPDPLSEPAIVLVDEFDSHLHPKWQSRLVGLLTAHFPKVQFIVTAHSPLVVQAHPNTNVVLLRRVGDHVVVDNDPEFVTGWRVDQLLTSDLFGLESSRPDHYVTRIRERADLMSKLHRSPEESARLAVLDDSLGELDTVEDSGEREAMALIRRMAGQLQNDTD